MSLPSGYKRLEFVRSSGTQYIDLGVKPNRGYAIEIKAKCSATSKQTFGGCDTSWKSNGFMLAVAGFEFGNNANTSLKNYGSEPITLKLSADGGYKNGTKTWDTSSIPAFQATANFTLCALNRNGTPQEYLSGDTYYCKIWDDSGTLIRDCIPCESTSGVVGLWDDVNSVFYSGVGTFTAGPVVKAPNKTMIDGTGRELKTGRCLVGGTGYAVKKGRTLIGGTGYDISLLSGTPISELPVGNTVKIAVNATLRDFLIVHQGLPSFIYDDSCNGAWLLMKDIYEDRVWQSGNLNINKYESSEIHTYLNNTFLNLFDSNIKDVIKQVKIPYRKNGGAYGTDQYGANGLSVNIFLLSGYEVGWTTSTLDSFPVDGAKLSYFESGEGTSANNKRIANLNGSSARWWLRSPMTSSSSDVFGVFYDGAWTNMKASESRGVRPALILPSDTLVSDDGTITT